MSRARQLARRFVAPLERHGTPSPIIRARELVGAAGGSAAATLWLALLGLLTTPYMLHQLGAAAYGVFALISIVAAYLSNLEFGFGHALVRFAAKAHGEGDAVAERRVLETSLAVFLVAGTTAGAAAFALAPHVVHSYGNVPSGLQDDALTALRLGAVILLYALLSTFWTCALVAVGRFSIVVASRVVTGTLVSLAAVLTVAFGGGLGDVLLAQLVIGTASLGFLVVAATATQGYLARPRIHRPTFKAMARFSGFVFVAGLAFQLMLQSPPTVLAAHVSTAELATYAIPAIVLQQLLMLASSASLGFLPMASAESAGTDRTRLASIFGSHLRLTLLVMGPIVAYLAVFAETLLSAWIDDAFAAQAAGPLRFLAVGALIVALGAPPADVVRGLGRPGWLVVYAVGASAIEIVAALALVTEHGAAGVAFALLLGVGLATPPLIVAVAHRLLGISVSELTRSVARPLAAVLAAAGAYALASALDSSFAVAILTGFVATGLYAWVVYRGVLSEPERRALRRTGNAS